MKKKAIMIDDVDNADSIMDDGYRRFMVNAINKHTSTKSDKINGPLICLDDDDDDDDDDNDNEVKIDENYKLYLDQLRDENKGPLFVYGNGKSDTRKFDIFSGDSKRSKLVNENPMDKRVAQQRKKQNVGFKGETSRVLTRGDIQRDNRVAERRKRRIAELESQKTSKAVPLVKSQQENKVGNISELKDETLWDVPLVYFVNKDVQFVTDTQRDNKVSKRRKSITDELKAQTLRRAIPLVRAEEDILRDNRIAEPRVKRKLSETKDAGTSSVVTVERVDRITELKDVDETSRKKNKESVVVVDKDYMSYLTWLVDSLKASTTKPMANLQKDPSDLDPPISDTLKESTRAIPEKDLPVRVKVEQDLESWSDDSDIIAMSDSPFLDGECTPFVASKKVIDLDEVSKEDESSGWFRKELMDVLKKPYNERELKQLHHEASIHRKMTRSRELRKGRESDYETDVLGQSYREKFADFEKEYKPVDGVDKVRALKLLRGFFFYLKNVSHEGAFKPWEKNQWWQP
ncbi:hypothetical protein V5N11_023974 [Cardamine amara subsp. amara]|uniref:Uncharacterized protein n=1 Tax=Cardamine amara subsp. amara TaxID=228776 RepID=A0ABD1BG67_CARAN